ncbi:ABC transporter permease [Halobellus ordinarius]|uniref:ABC transporter permease n=1 Tax=Halobellus ordinarius TaxID=3075120 RepID=UPI00288022ED|nr:ABC transporter permease [Halobellus sp. ZY16]
MYELVLPLATSGAAVGLLDATVRASTVLILAGLGELITQRSGVLNLGVEGMLLFSALGSFIAVVATGSYVLGFAVGVIIGVLAAGLHAFLSVSLNSNQVISGLMITLLGIGATTFFGQPYTGETIQGMPKTTLPLVGQYLVQVPVVGEVLFRNAATDFLAIALVPITWYFLFRTNLGLEILSVGEAPEAADTAGVRVDRLRYLSTMLGGALAGLAGAHLSLALTGLWSAGMAAGRGWIAIALVFVAQWKPFRMLAIAYVFAVLDALTIRIQAIDVGGAPIVEFLTHPTIMAMYPYIATVLVLVLASRGTLKERLGGPSALAQPYRRLE